MAFLMRRPFAVAGTLARELQQTAPRTAFRSFQTQAQQPIKQNAFKQATPLRSTISSKPNAFRNAFKQSRAYQTQAPQNPLAQGNLTQRLAYGGW